MSPPDAIDPRLVVQGHPPGIARSAVSDLVVPAVLVRARHAAWSQLVHVHVPHEPTVALSSRDLRSPGIVAATRVAREAGFAAVVRSPGGRMVAYDEGAVVVDHVTRSGDLRQAGAAVFAGHAGHHVEVLRSLGIDDARVGAVDGEYCPGEHSVNLGGQVKVIGSAQRVTGTGALFSTVVQVAVSDRVRDVIVAVSDALGYALRESSIGALTDAVPGLTAHHVAQALAEDYRRRLGAATGTLPRAAVELAATAGTVPVTTAPFDVDAWTRSVPLDKA